MEYRVTIELLAEDGTTLAESVHLSCIDEYGESYDGFEGDIEAGLDDIRADALEYLPEEA